MKLGVSMFAFKPGLVEVPSSGLQVHDHVTYLLEVHVHAPLPLFELSAFGVQTRQLRPINQKNGDMTSLVSLEPV